MFNTLEKIQGLQEKACLESISFSTDYNANPTTDTETISVSMDYVVSVAGAMDRRMITMTFTSDDLDIINDKKVALLSQILSEAIDAKTRFKVISTTQDNE